MVFSRKYIQSMEIRRLLLVDTRKACVTFDHYQALIPDQLNSLAGSGKSVLWFAVPQPFSAAVKLTSTI
jgi:hypothetical protein